MISSILFDLRYALRTLARNPGFAIVSVLALGLGIGANTAIFTVVNSVVLKPLDLDRPQQLVIVRERNLKAGFPQFSLSPGNYLGYRDQNHSFTGIAAYGGTGLIMSGGSEPERLRGTRTTLNLFDVLGRKPALGRTFTEQEGQLGSHRVAILSHGLWQRRFGGRSDILGQTLKLNEEIFTVVGVMPIGFQFPGRTDIWIPLAMNVQNWQQRGGHYLGGIGRLRPGVTIDSALADLNSIAALAEKQFPNSNNGWDALLQGLQDAVVGGIRPAIVSLTWAVGFVLLIACVNLANLLLSRSAARRREMGVRNSLGAGRWRLVRQLLTESVLLASIGAIFGLGLAWAGVKLLVTVNPTILPRAAEISLDGTALGFTAAIAVLTGILFGLAPAVQMSGLDLSSALRESGRGNAIGFRRNRLRSMLVIGEIALSLMLLTGAGLLMRSFNRLQSVDPGFDPHSVLTFRINLPPAKYNQAAQTAFYQRALDRLRALPGVTAAGAGQIFPLAGSDYILSFTQIGKPPLPPGSSPSAAYYATTPGFLSALRIPLKRGRDFTEHDDAAAPPVALISETMARQFYPNEDPIGQRIQMGNGSKPAEIVGIVGDVRDQELESKGRPAVYEPAAQIPFSGMYFGVRTAGDPEPLIPAVRAAFRDLDRELPLDAVGSVDALVATVLSQKRFAMLLMVIFASLALILAMVGIYGVISYSVTQATQEIGIRMALGAGRGDVLRMVIGNAGLLMGVGLTIGTTAAVIVARLIATQLFGVRPSDPSTYVMVAAALLATGLLACAIPALRATRVDPLTALRND